MHHSIFSAPNLPTAIFILRGKSEKYTKENMPVERFGSHVSHNGLINLISWPVCHIFVALSVDTHVGYSLAITPYGCTVIWLNYGQYGWL